MKNIVYNGKTLKDYFIDDKGNVYNKDKVKLKPWDDGRGYLIVDCGDTRVKIHMASAETFYGKRPKDMIVHHKDSNKHNNAKNNVSYITQKENVAHAQRDVKGKEYLSDSRVTKIKSMLKTQGIKEVSDAMKLPYHIVRDIKNNRTYK